MNFRQHAFAAFAIALFASAHAIAGADGQAPDMGLFTAMKWRLIGPFRAGRVTAVAGVVNDANTYYFGTPGGGVWKTSDAGHVWKPIFDAQAVSSIGALAVAPSDPKIIYAGTGETTPGDGIYKSSDSGATWIPAGLPETRFIQSVVVDPANPEVVVAGANSLGMAILWQPLPSSTFTTDRGIYKTTDGGRSWKKVLTKDDTAGVVDLGADPDDPRRLYASLFRPASGAVASTSDIYLSKNEGSTWAPLVSAGLPDKDRGRLGLTVAAGTHGQRLYAIINQGLFRSDDAGAHWRPMNHDPRVVSSSYFGRVFADTQNPDIVFVAQTSLYRSVDGGASFEPYVGAPSGDDFHVLWIDPKNDARMLLGVDQGAVVSVDAGQTWSSWYNQPTGQFYHVSTDALFPYHVYAAQQDSGTAAVASRSDYGEITQRDWSPVGGFEYCFIAPDPLHPNLVFSGGWYGTVIRFDKLSGQPATVFEKGGRYRTAQMAPLAFSPQHPDTLYLGTQYVLKTIDGGASWQPVSPDLSASASKENPEDSKTAAITAMRPSHFKDGEIWVGTGNRLVQVTLDAGASWKNVSPSGLSSPARIVDLEPSHYDSKTAYLTAGQAHEATPPLVLRTHDLGATWQKITNGLPEHESVRVVREDPVRRGLLYAGTDSGVFISFDDGDRWLPLRFNLPATPVTDIDVHDSDLVISTFGRALWILDDLTPLREWDAKIAGEPVHLFHPEVATRVRWDNNQDTPLPPETPAGKNPPDGAIINYFLKASPNDELRLVIRDAKGEEIRRYSSFANEPELPLPNVPSYWFAPVEKLPAEAGVNRFVWDLRYPAPAVLPYAYSGGLLDYTEYTLADHAIPYDTPRRQPQGPLVAPGRYSLELTVDGKTYRQPLEVKLDPRIHVSAEDLEAQVTLARAATLGLAASYAAFYQAQALSTALDERMKNPQAASFAGQLSALGKKVTAIRDGAKDAHGFGTVNRDLTRLVTGVESGDARPAETPRAAIVAECTSLEADLRNWRQLNAEDVPALNKLLAGEKITAVPIAVIPPAAGCHR